MSSDRDIERERLRARKAARLQRVCDGGLDARIQALGGVLLGFSVKCSGEDYLLTFRVSFEEEKFISFVGASSLENLLLKAHREAAGNKLRWKPDKW